MERTQAIDQGLAFLPCVAEDDLGLLTFPPTHTSFTSGMYHLSLVG